MTHHIRVASPVLRIDTPVTERCIVGLDANTARGCRAACPTDLDTSLLIGQSDVCRVPRDGGRAAVEGAWPS